MAIALERGETRVVIEPSIGGSIARFTWRGRDVLRCAPENTRSPLDMACFPLVPFANRIAYGRFVWQGKTITLSSNFGDHPHPLHGQGWQSVWRVISGNDAHAVLAFEHAAGEWPWLYDAQETFSLAEDSLTVALSLTNRGREPMPASLGFHPYFPRSNRTRLTASVEGMWQTDKTQIPTVLAAPILDFAKGVVLDTVPFVDNCFTGWHGPVRIAQPDNLEIAVHADARFLQIFLPEEAHYFCTEPVTAMPDAVNRSEPPGETGLLALAPGATYTISMTIALQERAS
jgi:aldose 1-epimerase